MAHETGMLRDFPSFTTIQTRCEILKGKLSYADRKDMTNVAALLRVLLTAYQLLDHWTCSQGQGYDKGMIQTRGFAR